jgi:hypothetical protein
MKSIAIIISIVAICFVGCGNASTKVPISRNFATLQLGMTGDEYRTGGWHNGFSKLGKIKALAYTGKTHVYRDDKDWAEKDMRLEAKYSSELARVREINCVFFNDKLCIIQIVWYADSNTTWDVFSQKAIDKYGNFVKTGLNSYSWDDGKTTLQIQKDRYTPYGMDITFDLNIATYIDNEIYSQMHEGDKKLSPDL